MPAMTTLLPPRMPVTALVMVTVVPLSDAAVIAADGPPHMDGSPVAQDDTPAAHPGIEPVAMKASVAGLYNSAEWSADCPAGAPEPAGGTDRPRNELPGEPPTINTWPSIAVPLPEMRVALGPLRAMVI